MYDKRISLCIKLQQISIWCSKTMRDNINTMPAETSNKKLLSNKYGSPFLPFSTKIKQKAIQFNCISKYISNNEETL